MSVPGKIPILDITPEVDELWPELSERLERVIRSGQFILGPETKNFESEIATFLGVKHAIGVNSGTDALVIGLRAAGIGEGHEVITTPFTFFATAESISNVGATPVFVDVDLATMNMNCDAIEAAVTQTTAWAGASPTWVSARRSGATSFERIADLNRALATVFFDVEVSIS